MIEIDKIRGIVAGKIESTELFLVDINISANNKILVLVDSWKSVSINDCIEISKKIEGSLDREVEDFELEVSSAGLDHAFRVPQQYKKNIGRNVEVTTLEGNKSKGKLISVDDQGIEIEFESKIKVEGKKKKQLIIEKISFLFENIKGTKVEISFK
ncbi:MAG: ribosome assembly cofactor RimP [Bacteroidota bacterium]|nr:ribosome assembly cofactor RimP [Bacteroidota bacterium]